MPEQKAIDNLPDFGEHLFVRLLGRIEQKTADSDGLSQNKNSQDTLKNAILAALPIAPRGFEPLSPG
jgi:hypothetical protein